MSQNLSKGWRLAGFEVEEFFYGSHMGRGWHAAGRRTNRETNQRLRRTADRLHGEGRLDLIFSVIYDDVLEIDTIKALRKYGVPMVNYHVDLVGQWYRVLRTGKYFDRVACAQRNHWPGLKRAGISPCYMPMAANPSPQIEAEETFNGALYLGSPWPFRRQVLAEVAKQGIPLRIYGNNWTTKPNDESTKRFWRKNTHDLWHYLWPRVREEGANSMFRTFADRLSRSHASGQSADGLSENVRGKYAAEDFGKLVRGAAINLGFTHFSGAPGTPGEMRQVRLREFEIPMADGFYLVQDCAQLRELYQPGVHLEVWNQAPDLCEKIRYYLSGPQKAREIASAGREHALAHHTWEQRFRGLLRELQVPMPRFSPDR